MIAVSSGLANAWGVSYSTDEIQMQAGQSADISYELQNFVGDETMSIKVSLEGDAGIAQIVGDDVFTLLPKTKDTYAKIRVSIPNNALSRYALKIKFLAMTGQGGFSINSAKMIPLTINVVDDSGQSAQTQQSAQQSQTASTTQEGSLAGTGQAAQGGEQNAQATVNTGAGATAPSGLVVLNETASKAGSALLKFAILAAALFIAAAGYWTFSKTRRVEFL